METSPMNSKSETENYYGYEFDPQADFTRVVPRQFLEEAKRHPCEGNFKAVSQHIEETGNTKLNGQKKNRKSWKISLFSWLKSDKKTKTAVEPLHGTTVPKLRRGIVSGPIHGSAVGMTSRARKPTSGLLTHLFSPAKREEDGIPYMCLSPLYHPHHAHSYGPVYLVT